MKTEAGMVFAEAGELVEGGMIIKEGVFALGVCVPADWTDEQISQWATKVYHCGATSGWHVRKEGDRLITEDSPERGVCEKDPSRVHVVLDF